jgi:hypothetical protein
MYRDIAEEAEEDCYAIDPCWLIDYHPELWHRMVALDDALSKAEREGDADFYRNKVQRLCDVVLEARALYVLEKRQPDTLS